jgi:hypothetical protein
MGSGLPGQPVAGLSHAGPVTQQRLLLDAGWAVVQNATTDGEHDGDKNKEFSSQKDAK